MLFFKEQINLTESNSSTLDGYVFKLHSGEIEIYDISKGINKESYIINSKSKFGDNVTIAFIGSTQEIEGYNIEGMLPKIKRYFSARGISFNPEEKQSEEEKQLEESYRWVDFNWTSRVPFNSKKRM